MYDSADRQLKKGEELFNTVLKPLASLSEPWKHYGFKVFPEVESRKVFADLGFLEENLQV